MGNTFMFTVSDRDSTTAGTPGACYAAYIPTVEAAPAAASIAITRKNNKYSQDCLILTSNLLRNAEGAFNAVTLERQSM
jgi:hypothetical protein